MCTCQICGLKYKVDIIVPNKIWQFIKPDSRKKGGLLCPKCIGERIEMAAEDYGYIIISENAHYIFNNIVNKLNDD